MALVRMYVGYTEGWHESFKVHESIAQDLHAALHEKRIYTFQVEPPAAVTIDFRHVRRIIIEPTQETE